MRFCRVCLCLITTLLLSSCGDEIDGNSSSVGGTSSSDTNSSSNSISVSSSHSSAMAGQANLVINEIVAKSDNLEFLAGNDWIEIYNPSNAGANLANYTLEDTDSGPITLPAIELAAYQFIVIAAVDEENLADFAISVPFKLGKEDTVTLRWSDQPISQLSWVDGDALEKTSFGLLYGVAQTLSPTPNRTNQVVIKDPTEDWPRGAPSGNSALKISEVVPQSDRPSYYDSCDWIELVNTSNTSLNLNEYALADSASGIKQLPAIILSAGESIVILAGGKPPSDGMPFVDFGLGRQDSLSVFQGSVEVDYVSWTETQSKNGRSFGRLNNQLQILYPTPGYANVPYTLFTDDEVFEVRIGVSENDWRSMLANPQAEQYYPATFDLNGASIENVGFRIKGQGSLNFVRNSVRYGFKVDMNLYQDQKFMGMKKLVFNQSFADPSFMRDKIAYDLMRDAGVPSPQISYVNLWVGSVHLGLYQMVEMIDTEFLETHFPEDDETGLGDLYKGEIGQRLTWSGNQYSSYKSGLPLKNNEDTVGTTEEGSPLINFLDAINNGSNPLASIRTDIMIKYLAALVLTGNMDSPIGATANNFYLYENRAKNQFTILPWDFNLGFGMWGNGPALSIGGTGGGFGGFGPTQPRSTIDCQIVEHVIDNPVHDTNSTRPMLDALLKDDALKLNYHVELQYMLDQFYNDTYMRAKINRIAQLIDPFVQADPTKFFTDDEWRLSLEQGLPSNSDITNGRGAGVYGPAPGLLTFIQQKANYVQRQLRGEQASGNNGGTACPGS